jgi:hypothetical protein
MSARLMEISFCWLPLDADQTKKKIIYKKPWVLQLILTSGRMATTDFHTNFLSLFFILISMFNSLKLYATYFSKASLSKWKRRFLFNDLYRSGASGLKNIPSVGPKKKQSSLKDATAWLLRAQEVQPDAGFGSFHLINGWSSSYPETSGYIIPTLLNFAVLNGDENIKARLKKSADWLIEIQKPSGGWQGGRVQENKTEIVFNTAQIIRGMLAMYQEFREEKYLKSAEKAGDWLCEIQHDGGYWKKFALMEKPRVYDSYVDAPLLELWKTSKKEKYKIHALKNLDWIVDHKQEPNGWFEDCDNTVKRNAKPILHTISYTIDGLLDSGILLDDLKYIEAAILPANVLLEKFNKNHYLNGRFDRQWNGSEYMLTTGCAQIAIIWLKLAQLKNDKNYFIAAQDMNNLLVYIQNRKGCDSKDTRGAMPGSFPVWGRYEPFAFPNWACKYFCDSLLLEQKLAKQFNAS